MTVVINLFGGPGSGKSTTAAGLFYGLKTQGISCEIAREYAKDVVWEGRDHLFDDQLYIFAKQRKRIRDLQGKVDFIICDSPLLLSMIYGVGMSPSFQMLVREEHSKLANWNIFLQRTKPYQAYGRLQSEFEAKLLDPMILAMLDEFEYTTYKQDLAVPQILERIIHDRQTNKLG